MPYAIKPASISTFLSIICSCHCKAFMGHTLTFHQFHINSQFASIQSINAIFYYFRIITFFFFSLLASGNSFFFAGNTFRFNQQKNKIRINKIFLLYSEYIFVLLYLTWHSIHHHQIYQCQSAHNTIVQHKNNMGNIRWNVLCWLFEHYLAGYPSNFKWFIYLFCGFFRHNFNNHRDLRTSFTKPPRFSKMVKDSRRYR